MQKILLTSFQTWLPHQQSNASDDLLEEVAKLDSSSYYLTVLRHLPVDIPQASERAIAKINEVQPDIIICCGMAESRQSLSVESNATQGHNILKTSVNLDHLLADSIETIISHDAGKFVCEGLYYSVLNHTQLVSDKMRSLFIHVPVLTRNNSQIIQSDFELILNKLIS
jgi:pyroglutamyl-peptidase